MKYTKYMLVLVLMLFIGLNRVMAKTGTCYYISNEMAAQVDVRSDTKMVTYLDRLALKMMSSFRKQDVENLKNSKTVTFGVDEGMMQAYNKTYEVPKYESADACPKYIIFFDNARRVGGYHTYATNSEQVALEMKSLLSSVDATLNGVLRQRVLYAQNRPGMTKEEYYKEYMKVYSQSGIILDGQKVCNLDDSGCTLESVCEALLGTKDNPESIRSFLNTILLYVRIIVPILIIVFGSIDFARAVLAGKEDEMKKAQINFVKRIIAGVVVFFVPALINVIMSLADILWDYSTCSL